MTQRSRIRAHVIVGGFPPGTGAAHDMDYVRRRLLELLAEDERIEVSVANDFQDLERWLPATRFLLTYVAGPHPDPEQCHSLDKWLDGGGRWLGLHGTSGGRAAPVDGDRRVRKMVKASHHTTLGAFFLNHPPVRRFRVDVADREHALTRGLPASFEVADELYLLELQQPEETRVLLTTELDADPSPPGFGFRYDADTSALADGRTRPLAFVRESGQGAVAYVALGHCHSPTTNGQPFVHESVQPDGATPPVFRGAWEDAPFLALLRNAIAWGSEGS